MLATVVDPTLPALVFMMVTVTIGLGLATLTRRIAASSLLASAVVIAGLILLKRHLPRDFSAYTQDLIYEPLIGDHFLRHIGEGVASAFFHFGLPYMIIAGLIRYRGRRKMKRESNQSA